MSLEVTIKGPFYIYSRAFLQFTSPSLSLGIYALPSCLPLLDVCLPLPINLFKLSPTYHQSFLPPTLQFWFISLCFRFHSGIDQQKLRGLWDLPNRSSLIPLTVSRQPHGPVCPAASKCGAAAVRHHLSASSSLGIEERECGNQENNPLYPGLQPMDRHFSWGSAFIPSWVMQEEMRSYQGPYPVLPARCWDEEALATSTLSRSRDSLKPSHTAWDLLFTFCW